jgi:hypothetical protein
VALRALADGLRGLGVETRVAGTSLLAGGRRVATAMRKWGVHLVCGHVMLDGSLEAFAATLRLSGKDPEAGYSTVGAASGRSMGPARLAEDVSGAWARVVGESGTEPMGDGSSDGLDLLVAWKYARERWLGVR